MKQLKKVFAMLLVFSMLMTSISLNVSAEEKAAEPLTANEASVDNANEQVGKEEQTIAEGEKPEEEKLESVKPEDEKLADEKAEGEKTPEEQKEDVKDENEKSEEEKQTVLEDASAEKVDGQAAKEEEAPADAEESESKKPVTVNAISVVYADGRSVEDGHMFDVFDSAGNTKTYTVKNGKLSGIQLMPNEQHKIFISWSDPDEDFSWDYAIVMEEDTSFKVGVSEGSTQLMRWLYDEAGKKIAEKPVKKLVIKKFDEDDPVEPGKMLNVADIPVVYEDGTPVEDGMKFDVFDMGKLFSKQDPEHYYVRNGKLSGIKMRALVQHKIGFDVSNEYWKKYEVVGAPDSVKLLRIYAKYENELPLYYDYDEGINAPEEKITKIVVKKLADGDEAVQTRPTSCIMNLLISDGGYQAEGGLPFHLIRVDNGKKKTVYSDEGELTLIANANVEYRLELGENPIYKLENPIEFSCLLDKQGKYQAVRKGGDVNNTEDYITCSYIELTRIDGEKPGGDQIEDEQDDSRFNHVYVDSAVTLKGMKVVEVGEDGKETSLEKKIKFKFYNATTQTVEKIVYSEKGMLPDVEMKKGQNYIVFAEDVEYEMDNRYILLEKSAEKPICYKCGQREDGFYLTKRSEAVEEKDVNRVAVELPVFLEDGSHPTRPIKFKFVSPLETVEAVSGANGMVNVGFLEDNNYMVLVEDKEYSIESFPIAIKDKSEYGAQKYPFNHFTCGSMSGLFLVAKGSEHNNDTVLISADKKTTLTGLNFRGGDFHLNVRILDIKIPELQGKDYEVLDIDTINMYRTEISKLAAGNFTITREIPAGKAVKEAYYIDEEGKLQPVEFTQAAGKVSFVMNSVSLYNNVLVYEPAKEEQNGEKPNGGKPNGGKPNGGNEGGQNQNNGGATSDQKDNVNHKEPAGADAPKTGDEANVGVWVTVMLFSIACFSIFLSKKKKEKMF